MVIQESISAQRDKGGDGDRNPRVSDVRLRVRIRTRELSLRCEKKTEGKEKGETETDRQTDGDPRGNWRADNYAVRDLVGGDNVSIPRVVNVEDVCCGFSNCRISSRQ